MRSWTRFAVVLVVFGAASTASAQPRPSAREQAYGRALAAALGQSPGAVTRFETAHGQHLSLGSRDDSAVPPRPRVRGVQVDMPAVQVERLRFETAEQAQQHSRWLLDCDLPVPTPYVAELRGNQLVVVRGELARDPASARRALGAAWNGLPAPATSDATFADLGDGLALTTTLPGGPLRAGVDDALAKAREVSKRPDARGVELTADGARVQLDSGFTANLRSDAAGASLSTTTRPSEERAMSDYLAGLGGHPEPRAAGATDQARSKGAARTVDGLFGH